LQGKQTKGIGRRRGAERERGEESL